MKVYRDITDNNGVVTNTIEIFDIMEGTYSGTDMGERSITATIQNPTPIDFKAGDYVEFNIADLVRQTNVEGGTYYERFYIYTMPTIKKTASNFSAKDAYEHTVTFYPRQYELGCTQMRDLIQDNGNNVLYTGWDEFSFYGGAKLLMDRIMAVLHERFGTKGVAGIDYWDYKIADEVNEEKNTALEKFQFDFSANSVMDALLKLNEEEGINTKFFINSRMIYVGYKRPYIVGVDDNNIIKTTPFNFQYGQTSHLPQSVNNGGLYSITKSTGQATPITRLYAYGSDRNLHRFYCSDRIKSGRYVNRLMLPSFGDDGVTDYIESEEGIAKFGIREGSKTFDEIYPSLRYFTYGDLREIKYVIKLMGCGIESDDDNVYDAAQEHKYPIARVQCYKVIEGSNGVNTLVKSAPPVDLAIFLHATGKVVKCTLYADKDGKSSIQRQIAADGTWSNGNGRIPANSLQGRDYIVGSCFAIHDSGYADNNTTITSRNDWFRNTDTITGSNGDGELTEEQKKLVNEIEIHQINYTDTSWITDIYEFEEYEQTHFSRHGYSAYCYPRINKKYPNSQSDSIDVNEVVEVGSVIIEDTELNISEGKNQATYEIYLKDIGFKINEQNWFGEYVFLIDTVKVNFLDGNLGGYSFDVLKETDANELAENIVPAHLPNGEKNPAFFDNAQDTVQATRAYEKGAFWRIVLKRCDTEINNYWLPNTMLNANAGDRIVLLDIYMPDIYQRAAENRLLREATKYLDANDDGDIQYTFDFDKVRLQQIPALARQLREGAIMRIVDNDLQIKTENKTKTIRNNDVPVVYTKSLTYSDVSSAVVEENTYVANRDVEYLKGKGIEQVEITADIDVHHEGERGGHGGQGEVVWTFKSGEFNLVISDEDTKNTLQTIGDNKIKVTLYSESKNAYFERVCTIKEKIDRKTYKLVLSEDAFEKSEYTGLGSVYVMYSVLIKDSSINVDVTKKILPYGTNVFCEAVDLIDFQANKYYEVTIDVEDNGLAAIDSGIKKTLFALVNGLGEGQQWFIPNYTLERVDETKKPFRGFAKYDRYTFKFTLGEDFNDNRAYYPAIRYISDGETDKVSVRLVSVIERDSDSLIDMNYVDLGIETLSINFHDNTRVTPAIPMSYEITATVKEETRASAWVQVMQRIDSTEIVGEQNIRTQETIANMARRHYRELLALKGSIFDPDGTCDQTFLQVMMMQVGADSMNYQLDNTRTGLNKDGLQTLFNCLCANNKFEVGASDRLRHYVFTQGVQGGTWDIAGNQSFALDGENTYFVAIKCERNGKNGQWVCETNQHMVDEDANYWYFNWAIINLVSGEYVLTETRGNAYMYGDNLICGKISTLAGQSYFDLTHGNFVLSDGIKPSLSYIDGVLTISGVNSDDAGSILSRLGITEGIATGAQSTADAANDAAKAAQTSADSANAAAKAAKQAADNAQATANNAQTAVNNVTDDGIISGGTEKANLKREWQSIAGENLLGNTNGSYFKVLSQAQKYRVNAYTMQQFFSALKYAMDFILKKQDEDTTISAGIPTSASTSINTRDNFNLLWKNYYDAEIAVLNAVSDKIKSAADAAQSAAEQAGKEAKEYADGLTKELGDSLQNQIDGVIDSYFMEGVPYNTFRPSSDWGTNEVKNRHLGDTYTNILKNKANLAELDGNGNPLWIEQGFLSAGVANYGKTFEQQRSYNTNYCRTKTIFENYNGLTIGATPDGIQMIILLYDSNRQYIDRINWRDTAITISNASKYKYISILFSKGDGSEILNPSELVSLTSSQLTNPEAGKSWRWCNNDDEDESTFHWHEIADSDAVLALQKAADAQDTADDKRRVFVAQPTTPYDIGDLWAQGGASGQDILKCITARSTGSFKQSDWAAASSALSAAADAQQAADKAQSDATSSLTQLGDMSSDSMITPQEKVSIRTEWASIQQEYAKNSAKASELSLTYTAYTNAYNALNTYLTSTVQLSYATTVTITKSDFNSKFSTYYAENVNVLNAIAKALADAAADAVQVGGKNYIKDSETTSISATGETYSKQQKLYFYRTIDDWNSWRGKDLTISFDADIQNAVAGTESYYHRALIQLAFIGTDNVVSYPKHGDNVIYFGTSDNPITLKKRVYHTFKVPDIEIKEIVQDYIYIQGLGSGSVSISHPKLEFGNKATDWTAAPEDVEAEISALDYLKAALTDGSTEIAGGLTMTNVLMLKNLKGAVTAGMSGMTRSSYNNTVVPDNVLMWGGGTYVDAFLAALSKDYLKEDGTTITTLLKKDGTGKIGCFKINGSSAVVDNDGSKTIITTQTISDYTEKNNIGFVNYDKEFTSSTNVDNAQVLMVRTFDGKSTGTVIIKNLFCTVGIYGTDSLRSATAKLKVSVVYGTNNLTDTIIDEEIYKTQNNSSSNGYIIFDSFEKSYANIKSFKIELLSGSITYYGSIDIRFSAYAGIAGNNTVTALAKDGLLISSGTGDRFIVKPKDNNFCVIADIPIISTKEDVDKLEIGQLYTDSSGIVRRFSYEDATGDSITRRLESIYALKNGKSLEKLDLSGFNNVNISRETVGTLTINSKLYATGLPTSYSSTSTDKEVYLYDNGTYYTLRARDDS